MDIFRKMLDKCGAGGIKCNCCRPQKSRNKKDRQVGRSVRRILKQFLKTDATKD